MAFFVVIHVGKPRGMMESWNVPSFQSHDLEALDRLRSEAELWYYILYLRSIQLVSRLTIHTRKLIPIFMIALWQCMLIKRRMWIKII
jgi:hypothetical protein